VKFGIEELPRGGGAQVVHNRRLGGEKFFI